MYSTHSEPTVRYAIIIIGIAAGVRDKSGVGVCGILSIIYNYNFNRRCYTTKPCSRHQRGLNIIGSCLDIT